MKAMSEIELFLAQLIFLLKGKISFAREALKKSKPELKHGKHMIYAGGNIW